MNDILKKLWEIPTNKMRNFCALLLLGVVTYAQANLQNCVEFAAKVKETEGEGSSSDGRQVISLHQFLEENKSSYFRTVMASPFNESSADADDACTAPTYGKNCKGVEYIRMVRDVNEEKLSKVKFNTMFVGYTGLSGKPAIQYEMRIRGINDDYYIFQNDDDFRIKRFQLELEPVRVIKEGSLIEDHEKVLEALTKEFALVRYKPGKYNIYATCDLEHVWVTCEHNLEFNDQDPELTEDITTLKNLAVEKGKQLKVNKIETPFPGTLSLYIKNFNFSFIRFP